MRYLCLAYYDEKKFDALPKGELDAIVTRCGPHDKALHESGKLVLVASLAPTRTTKSVRPRNGEPSITDGPYVRSDAQLGAFFIVEASDLDEAARVASKHPAAHLGEQVGWGIEVRPIEFFEQS